MFLKLTDAGMILSARLGELPGIHMNIIQPFAGRPQKQERDNYAVQSSFNLEDR